MYLGSVVFGLASFVSVVSAQSEECYSSGSIVGAVFGTAVVIAALLVVAYFLWRVYWKGRRGECLLLKCHSNPTCPPALHTCYVVGPLTLFPCLFS